MQDNIETQQNQWLGAIAAMGRYQKLFITGCPRSGTTWLLNMLNGHPQIAGGGEGRFAWRLFPLLQNAAAAFNTDHKANGGSPQAFVYDAELHLVMRSFSDNTFVRYLIASGKSADAVRVVADKTPQHVMAVDFLRKLYPSCRFINIVRDPRDAATSALFQFSRAASITPEQYIETFITQSWKAHVEAAVAAEQQLGSQVFLNIRYEDLHSRETEVLKRCLAHIGVENSEAIIQACSNAGNFQMRSGGRERGAKNEQAFYRNGMIGDWVNHLTPEVADRICRPVEVWMAHFGYRLTSANQPASALVRAA